MNIPQYVWPTAPELEVKSERIVQANQQSVFEAWTDAERLKLWWGPNGFSNTFSHFELKVSGKWIFTMHGPDGKNYANESQFVAIEAPSFLAFNHISPPVFQIQAHFEAITAKETKVIFNMVFLTTEDCAQLRGFVTDKNEENLDRLEAELKRMNPTNK